MTNDAPSVAAGQLWVPSRRRALQATSMSRAVERVAGSAVTWREFGRPAVCVTTRAGWQAWVAAEEAICVWPAPPAASNAAKESSG